MTSRDPFADHQPAARHHRQGLGGSDHRANAGLFHIEDVVVEGGRRPRFRQHGLPNGRQRGVDQVAFASQAVNRIDFAPTDSGHDVRVLVARGHGQRCTTIGPTKMPIDARWKAAGLLLCSNAFMTVAWYGHLRFRKAPLVVAMLASWGIALFEYMLQVPANRIGYGALSAYQLKILQEAITLVVFMVFAALWLGEGMQPRYLVSFALIFAAVVVAFR